MATEIAAKDLVMAYGPYTVWNGLSVSFRDSGLTCILGPNGVGKSTLMRALDKLAAPTGGTIEVDGVDIKEVSRHDLARKVAFVPVGSDEAFSMSVLDAVLMGRHPLSGFKSRAEDIEIAGRCIRMLDLESFVTRRFDSLSAGQHQKVMIARGLAQEPEILLLDEPTANLDIRHQLEVMKLLHDIAVGEGICVIAICHDINIAARFADRIVLLCDGRVAADGTPDEVITAENIESVYGVECEVIHASGRPYVVYHTENMRSAVSRSETMAGLSPYGGGAGCIGMGLRRTERRRAPVHRSGPRPRSSHKFKCELNLRNRWRHEVCSSCRS